MLESTPINVESQANAITSRKGNPWLIALGMLLVLVFAYGVFYARDQGSETMESKPSKTQPTIKTTKDAPSDSLLTAVLGAGAALIVIGVLYGRISTIKLPGGAEITLTDGEKAKTAEKAAEKHPDDPTKAALLAQEAQEKLLQEKAYGSVELPEEKIDSVVGELA